MERLLEYKKNQVKFEHDRAERLINIMIRYHRKLYEMYDQEIDVLQLITTP